MTARTDYPNLTAVEHDLQGDDSPLATELTFALDEIDRLRTIRDVVTHS